MPCRRVSAGSATTISPSTESASGRPLRSRMSPRSARRSSGDGALGGRHRGVRVGVDALQLHQPGAEHREHHGDDHEPEPEPQLRRAAQAAPRSPGRTRDRTTHQSGLLSGCRGCGAARACWGHSYPCRGACSRFPRRCPWESPAPVTTCGAGSSTAGFCGARGSSRTALSRVAGVGVPSTLPSESRRNAGRGRDDHAHPLCLGGHPLRVAQHVELHAQGLLPGGEGGGLLLHRGGGEGRLLHGGVEHQQPDHAGQQHEGHQGHERQRAVPAPDPGDDGQPRPLQRRAGESGDAAGGAGAADPAGPDLEGGAAHRLHFISGRLLGPGKG